jgi:hypothetical protein
MVCFAIVDLESFSTVVRRSVAFVALEMMFGIHMMLEKSLGLGGIGTLVAFENMRCLVVLLKHIPVFKDCRTVSAFEMMGVCVVNL